MRFGIMHTGVKQDQSIRADKVDTASSSFTTEQEDELFAFWIVELVNKLLTLVRGHCAIQTEIRISDNAWSDNLECLSTSSPTHFFDRSIFSKMSSVWV